MISARARASSDTLALIKSKGFLSCGVNTGLPGFSAPDTNNNWTGMDVDFCRALAAAVLGDTTRVKYKPLTAKERFTALQSGEIDILSRNTTWTQIRDTSLGLNFAGVNYYDGQGFMVKKSLRVKSAKELDGAVFCMQAGTTTELNLADYARLNKFTYKSITFETNEQVREGFETGRCDVLTTDQSGLYSHITKLSDPDSAMVLPEMMSKEPLGPVVRQGDDAWFNVVRWTLHALINAEELGVTSENIEQMKSSSNPAISRLLGTTGDMGAKLGLDNSWAFHAIKQVGNYGEIFERNVGRLSPLKIRRGLNALWNRGGIMFAPPIR
ncbi:MAG: amino acid ABC transporter substrate-binding protein [Proteobacteria bacterium]|nr:amino acid ABC transporter substrate-binding protein [Pseudomonadota bacterium]